MLYLPDLPEGFVYLEQAIQQAEEANLLLFAEQLAYQPFVMRGRASRRMLARFGASYGQAGGAEGEPPSIPDILLNLRNRVAPLFGFEPEDFVSALFTRYPPGAAIGWHRDFPVFGPAVLGVSLLAAATFRLRLKGETKNIVSITLAPRSVYAMSGNARYNWEHSILPVGSLRYSVTFRTKAVKR